MSPPVSALTSATLSRLALVRLAAVTSRAPRSRTSSGWPAERRALREKQRRVDGRGVVAERGADGPLNLVFPFAPAV